MSAPHGQVSAIAAGGAVALLLRLAGSRRTALAAGPELSADWLAFRAQPRRRRGGLDDRRFAGGGQPAGAGTAGARPLRARDRRRFRGRDLAWLGGDRCGSGGESGAGRRGWTDAGAGGAVSRASLRTVTCLLAAGSALAAGCTRAGEVLRVSDSGAPVVLQVTDVRLAAGSEHACAVAAGVLRCWGADGNGRLGAAAADGGVGQAPVAVAGGPWMAPAAGHRAHLRAGRRRQRLVLGRQRQRSARLGRSHLPARATTGAAARKGGRCAHRLRVHLRRARGRQPVVLGLQQGRPARAGGRVPRRRSAGAGPARHRPRLDLRRHWSGPRLRHSGARSAVLLGT